MVFQLAEDGVAEFLVEAEGLKGKGVQPDAGALALAGDVFGLVDELAADAGAAQVFGDKEEFDEEPFVGGASPEAAYGSAVLVLEEEPKETVVGVGRGRKVVVDEALEDGFALAGNVFFDDADGGKHCDRIALAERCGVKKLPRLYAIVDRDTLDARGTSVGEFARELRDAGVRLVQYRDKSGSPQQILCAAEEIAQVFAGVEDAMLVMNDRVDLAVLAGWGVHVGHLDVSPADVRRIIGERASVIGVSTHNEAQVTEADAGVADYVATGPVFATATKANAEPVVGLEGVRRARALTQKPLVAIGGITRENARSVIDAGADSVAVIGALLAAGERPGKIAKDFLDRLR
jgi:thiamine-phosphate pyrophosphorylase